MSLTIWFPQAYSVTKGYIVLWAGNFVCCS